MDYTQEQMDKLREQIQDIMQKEGLSQADISRRSAVAYGTLTGWLKGNYQGNNERVAFEIDKWIKQRASDHEKLKGRIVAPEFQNTKISERIIETLTFAQALPEISVVGAASGLGKTTTCKHFALTRTNVWMVTIDPSMRSVASLIRELSESLNIFERSPARMKSAILRRIRGTKGLIIVDEAQYLTTESLDFMRSLYDLSDNGIGLALVGNETISMKLTGANRKGNYAQLYSRIGMRWSQSKPKPDDIRTIIDAWDITDQEMIKTLMFIGKKPGAIRNVTKVMQLALMLSRGREEKLCNEHLKQAYHQLSITSAEAA